MMGPSSGGPGEARRPEPEGAMSRHEFANESSVTIDPGPPGTVTSAIAVDGLGGARLDDVVVTVDIDHSWVGDLTLTLVNPDGARIVLVDRRGGRNDHFRGTTFDAGAATPITSAVPPFEGSFRPEGDLAQLRNGPAEGTWTLEVRDRAFQDGGALRRWGLAITTTAPQAPAFAIEVRYRGGLTTAQQAAFDLAARRWSEIIVADLPDVRVGSEVVDDVVIEAEGVPIDGPGRTLGQAGPTRLRPESFLPAWGIMSFDTADLEQMEDDGSLVRVIMHEMAHVLGFGTIWSQLGLRQGAGTVNPRFTGANAMRELSALRDGAPQEPVPLANVGGPGTVDSHWREAVFGNELMTGFLDTGVNPISRLTVAALEDMGYAVDYAAADPYAIPSSLMLAIMGVGAEHADHGGHGIILVPDQVVLPPEALV
jgi:subtilisin-like proprotein convertase family protein